MTIDVSSFKVAEVQADSTPADWWDQVGAAFNNIIGSASGAPADPDAQASAQLARDSQADCNRRAQDIRWLKKADEQLQKRIKDIGDVWIDSHMQMVRAGASDAELLRYYGDYKALIGGFEQLRDEQLRELGRLQREQAQDCSVRLQALRNAGGSWRALRGALQQTAPYFRSYPQNNRQALHARQDRLKPPALNVAGRYNEAVGFERKKTGKVRALASTKPVDWLPDPPG